MIPIKTIQECDSTMNVASDMFESQLTPLPFAVRAVHQTKSRGTGGRTWLSQPGNLHLTIAIPMPFTQLVSSSASSSSAVAPLKKQPSPKTMALFPCLLGIALFNALNKVVGFSTSNNNSDGAPLSSSPLVLKWPNDVLIRATGEKVCGNLIETAYDKVNKKQAMLIGIGVNVETPVVVSDGGRKAGTLRELIGGTTTTTATNVNAELVAEVICAELVETITSTVERLENDEESNGGGGGGGGESKANKKILDDFHSRLEWETTTVFLRKEDDATRTERNPEPFKPIRLNEFGGLVARSEHDGREVELSSNYLY